MCARSSCTSVTTAGLPTSARLPCFAVDTAGGIARVSGIAVVRVVLGGVEVDGIEYGTGDARAGAKQEITRTADGMFVGLALPDDEHDGVCIMREDDAISDGKQRRRVEDDVGVKTPALGEQPIHRF